MTIEEEREFHAQWQELATSGGVLSIPPIHAALIERQGHAIPLSTTYRLLARHGWRKVQPDTRHPESDPAAQDGFKKNSRKQWLLLPEKRKPAACAAYVSRRGSL